MDEQKQPEEAPDTDEEPTPDFAPTDAEKEAEAEEAGANLMAKIEMNVYGHP